MEVSGSTVLYPVFRDLVGIRFDENDEGTQTAGYTAPAAMEAGSAAASVRPADPERPGFTFGGLPERR